MSIFLTSTSNLLETQTTSPVTVAVHVSYIDINGTTITPNSQYTSISAVTGSTTICSAPAASTARNIKYVSIFNSGAATSNFQVFTSNGTIFPVAYQSTTFPAGAIIEYQEGSGWKMFDATGAIIQTTPATGSGRLLNVSLIQTGTTTFTTTAATNSIRSEIQAAGGSGGGNAGTAGTAGGGGASGGFAEWVVAVSPSTTYSCSVGAGVNGTSAAAGTTGNNTTLTIGATTCTAHGGPGGAEGTSATVSVAGGASPAVSTNGTVNCGGEPGGNGQCATTGNGGVGGSSPFGGGGAGRGTTGAGNSAAALGFGGGGGGSFASTATAEAGGASAPGCIVIYEYS